MKALETFRITPVAAAVFVASALLASGCNKHTDDTTPPAAADTATTTPPPADTATTPPANASVPSDNMASDTGAMSGTDTSAMPPTDMAANGPVTDTQFYQDALNGGQNEIDASKMESKSGSSAEAKKLADKLIADHTAMGKKVVAAGGSAVTAPTPGATPPADLQGKTGKDLDKAWVDMMVMDHQKAIAMFENASKNASTDKAKQLATDALPTLRDHLKAVQDLQTKMGSM
jgi:putative membrane protein